MSDDSVMASRKLDCHPRAVTPDWQPWPHDQPPQYNGSGSPCDMWIGPCSCGATHTRELREMGGQ